MKQLSIIIPVYNAEKYIRQCLESIYIQSLNENTFEVLIIDDGSKDKSMENIYDLTKKHHNLKIIKQLNQGVSIARNNGLKAARGTYVWFMDADDMLANNCLKRILNIAKKNSLDILKFDHAWLKYPCINKSCSITSKIPPHITECKSGQEGFIEYFNPAQGYVWQYIFRREILIDNNLQFIDHIIFCEDWIFSISALLAAKRFMSIPLQAYIYRQHEESAIRTLSKKAMLSLNVVAEQASILLRKECLNVNSKEKMKYCIFHLLTLNLWLLAHTPKIYVHRREIIGDLKSRIPHFVQKRTFHEWKFSIYYNYCPSFYVWLRYHMNKS